MRMLRHNGMAEFILKGGELKESFIPRLVDCGTRTSLSNTNAKVKAKFFQDGDAFGRHARLFIVLELVVIGTLTSNKLAKLWIRHWDVNVAMLFLKLSELINPLIPSLVTATFIEFKANRIEFNEPRCRELGRLIVLKLFVLGSLQHEPIVEVASLFRTPDIGSTMLILVFHQLGIHDLPLDIFFFLILGRALGGIQAKCRELRITTGIDIASGFCRFGKALALSTHGLNPLSKFFIRGWNIDMTMFGSKCLELLESNLEWNIMKMEPNFLEELNFLRSHVGFLSIDVLFVIRLLNIQPALEFGMFLVVLVDFRRAVMSIHVLLESIELFIPFLVNTTFFFKSFILDEWSCTVDNWKFESNGTKTSNLFRCHAGRLSLLK
mmetsp:Transcript_14053/g.25457  ORF Transcript_14053/g.25457 Transcript_14053/m.25457 type:complete len:380 (+) Transcript_14053:1057-2196(+)